MLTSSWKASGFAEAKAKALEAEPREQQATPQGAGTPWGLSSFRTIHRAVRGDAHLPMWRREPRGTPLTVHSTLNMLKPRETENTSSRLYISDEISTMLGVPCQKGGNRAEPLGESLSLSKTTCTSTVLDQTELWARPSHKYQDSSSRDIPHLGIS